MGVSVGIVGVGSFGSVFIRHFKPHPQVERLALCDLNAERLAKRAREFDISETYASLDELLASDIQAVAIITQPWLHAAQAIRAMEAGKHVYSAVPAAYDHDGDRVLECCDRLVETAHRTGQLYMLGETTFFRRETIYCRRRAAEGAFGRFVYGEGEYLHDLDDPHTNLREVARRRWADKWSTSKSGGVPMHYPTHSVSGLVSVMGAHMTNVSARGYVHPDDDWWRPDTEAGNLMSNEVALYQMSNGATARICEFRRIGHSAREGIRVFGTEGSFVDDVSGTRWVTRTDWEEVDLSSAREPLPDELKDDLGGHGGSHAYLVHEFVDSVARERLPRINVWEAVRYLAPGVMAHKSAMRDGETLQVPDWGDPPRK